MIRRGRDYLEVSKGLKHVMILFELGYGGYAVGMIYGKLKNRYSDAHKAFEVELRR